MYVKVERKCPIVMENEDIEVLRKTRQLLLELSRRMSEYDCEYVYCGEDADLGYKYDVVDAAEELLDALVDAKEIG